MLRGALQLRGYQIEAEDGKIGTVQDLYFDDLHWGVRYLVVDTGSWLPGRRVLICPAAMGKPDAADHALPVRLTKARIQNSPSVASERPVSRQLEKDLTDYFSWPAYWTSTARPIGPMSGVPPLPPGAKPDREVKELEPPKQREGDPHLRSMREVAGYRIRAQDGEIGHIDDFVIDDEAWVVRYLVIDTRNWLPGRHVILAPDWFGGFDWRESKAHTRLSKSAIQNAPAYDGAEPISRDYESRLHEHYDRPAYWTEDVPGMGWRL